MSGQEASQIFMAPLSYPVIYKFFAFESPLDCVEFELVPSFCVVSNGKSGKISFASKS